MVPALAPMLQLGLTAPYAVQPGARLGARVPVRPLGSAALIVGGDLAAYTDPGDHTSALGGATVGARWQREGGMGLTVEGGLAAIAERQRLGEVVDLGSGELSTTHEQRLWLLPSVAGRLSWQGAGRLGAYTGLTVGHELGFGRDGAATFTLDAGLQLRLGALP